MTRDEAYELGKHHGLDIGRENVDGFKPTERGYDAYLETCEDWASDGFRQYSPFEFYAKELNDDEDSDALWKTYEYGVTDGLKKAWSQAYGKDIK